ncbi:hypothetical protein B0H13DRAFT_1625090 [Mycena leptocephala]|nr:hypothetical protein B0H13DRAFT_1625090 [Mycena leptocephala]
MTHRIPDVYQQYSPISYAAVGTKVDQLVNRHIAFPAFKNSVFTTSEINFCDAPSVSRQNYDAAFDTMEAFTSLGFYDHEKGGHLILPDDNKVIELPPGTTVLLPAGTKRFNFAAVGKREKRFLFRQFCSAGVLRWVEKGGRTDREFQAAAGPQAIQAWNNMCRVRGETSLKSFTKLRDVYVC